MTVAGAVEGLLAVGGVPLGQVAKAHTLQHGVGEQRAAGGLQIVALHTGLVDDLPEHAALGILERDHCVHGVFEHRHDCAVLIVEHIVHALKHVDHRNKEPAHGTQPEVGAAAGHGVGPVHLAALVIAVVVQAGFGVLHVLLDIHELFVAVNAAVPCRRAEPCRCRPARPDSGRFFCARSYPPWCGAGSPAGCGSSRWHRGSAARRSGHRG